MKKREEPQSQLQDFIGAQLKDWIFRDIVDFNIK